MIRDRIVFGVSDTRLKERLLCESSDLTLEKAVENVCSNLRNKSPLLETSVVLSSYGEFKVKPEGKLNLSCKNQGMEQTSECSPGYDNYASHLSGKRVSSIVDEKDGFWQVP
ncbi:unnamed protein product, partial [Porites evermanni]